jgi:hypothetical protein
MLRLFFLISSLLVLLFLKNHSFDYPPVNSASVGDDHLVKLYQKCELTGILSFEVFSKAVEGIRKFNPQKNIISICDFTLPSFKERFFVIDLEHAKLITTSLVAHGRNSGLIMANSFSNKPNSLQSSLGFFRVGSKIKSPKHGDALLLEGLEKGLNDQARNREIIIHAAEYVSKDYIEKNGKLGRSFGCPALPSSILKTILPKIGNGSLLYIHGQQNIKA